MCATRISQNPYHIYDQITWPKIWNLIYDLTIRSNHVHTCFILAYTESVLWFRLICEGLLLIFFSMKMNHVHIKARVHKPKWSNSQFKTIPNLWPKRLKNHTRWGHTHLYSPSEEVPPPPATLGSLVPAKRSLIEVGLCTEKFACLYFFSLKCTYNNWALSKTFIQCILFILFIFKTKIYIFFEAT